MLIDAQRQIRPGDQAGSCFHALGPNWWDQIYHQPAGHDLPLHQRPKRIAEAGNGDVLPQLKKLRLSEGEDGDMLVDTEDSVVFVSGLWSNAPKQDLPYRFLQAKFCVLGRALYQQFGRNRLFLLFTPLRVRSRPHRSQPVLSEPGKCCLG
ncbi:unnamed protein product [Durusdinium trenchii]|uniref:Uncharacterized protein n=1 Tax=Durusdinium trenchii TaxID=1381693 RepID=A0ABP0IQC9_9DINO